MMKWRRIVGFELENLLCKKVPWVMTAAYTAAALVICLWEELRQSYFAMMESVPVMLLNFVAPVFLAMILIGALAPVFAGDREQNVDQIPAACLAGRRGRSAAKVAAAVLFAVLACLFLGGVTFAISCCGGLFDGSMQVRYVGTGLELFPVWTVRRHFAFSLMSLMAASVMSALLILFVSYNAKTTVTAVSVSGMAVILEFLFHRFSFPVWVREYNLWVFFEPYYFFVMELFPGTPEGNLLLLWAAFLPWGMFGVRRMVHCPRE
ncbi:MAG: hypothetical protein NC420_14905 [Eubacterium sp.]|nr:hypothetical protein [Eubacterium sp.]MCM1217584.1 hypothetical protein [Lachnospiraceae bacterium]MCM1305321.1 hypothetical protein [Butyrivibrio sp.]MCM1345117.1 hypothetical protein [Muribaculaceae bacterium]MCM1239788.1 hypothetical protein [Lachnospiraceae bacterium]